jgi:hypothetical protein
MVIEMCVGEKRDEERGIFPSFIFDEVRMLKTVASTLLMCDELHKLEELSHIINEAAELTSIQIDVEKVKGIVLTEVNSLRNKYATERPTCGVFYVLDSYVKAYSSGGYRMCVDHQKTILEDILNSPIMKNFKSNTKDIMLCSHFDRISELFECGVRNNLPVVTRFN